ncbi:MAG: glycosyltransferase family 1 protein [Candidatus Competibacteraceae bacterium]
MTKDARELIPMRVGIDASNIRTGGGVTHLVEILRAVNPAEHDISRIIVWGGLKTLAQLPDEPWLELAHQPLLDGSLLHRTYWQKMRLTGLAQKQSDVLFVPGTNYSGEFQPFLTMMQNLLPFDTVERYRYGLSWMHLRLLLLHYSQIKSFKKSNGIIFLSDYARKALLNQVKFKKEEEAVIPHGINEDFRFTPRPQLSLSNYSFSKPFRFLYVSIVDIYKHQWHVVEAIAKLRQEKVPIALDLIGPAYPPVLHRLLHVIEKLDPDKEFIHYHGAIPYSDLARQYYLADGFIFASTCETFGQILTEAMAAGLPIACSNRSAMPEILGDAGVYFNPESVPEITDAIRTLVENPELRANYADKAFEKAKSYSWTRCAYETFAFIRKVAQSASNSRSKFRNIMIGKEH